MQILAEQIEKVLTRVLEAMDTEADRSDRDALEANEYEGTSSSELGSDSHHTLIEPCW